MNFSSPNSMKNLIATSPPTPLTMGRTLLLDLRDAGASLTTFTTMLTDITTATALLTDLTLIFHLHLNPNIKRIRQMARYIDDMTIATGGTPYERRLYIGAIHDAARAMNADIAAETERYYDNMTILLSQTLKKMRNELEETGSFHRTVRRLGKDGLDSAQALKDLVGERPTAEYHEGYLSEIARYWRRWAGTAEARPYEEIWTYNSGRVLVQE